MDNFLEFVLYFLEFVLYFLEFVLYFFLGFSLGLFFNQIYEAFFSNRVTPQKHKSSSEAIFSSELEILENEFEKLKEKKENDVLLGTTSLSGRKYMSIDELHRDSNTDKRKEIKKKIDNLFLKNIENMSYKEAFAFVKKQNYYILKFEDETPVILKNKIKF